MLLTLTKPSRMKNGAKYCIQTMTFYKFAGFKTAVIHKFCKAIHGFLCCWHIALERFCCGFAYGVKPFNKVKFGKFGKTPAVVKFHFVEVYFIRRSGTVCKFWVDTFYPRFEQLAFSFPSISGNVITKNEKECCPICETSPISIWSYPQQQKKEHHNVISSIFCKFLCRFALCVVHCAGTVVFNILRFYFFYKKEEIATRAIPAGVEVENLRVDSFTPPANNSIRSRTVMCFHFLSVRLGMWVHIDLFLARLGFCHTITSLLKTEARLGGSFTIHSFWDFTKNLFCEIGWVFRTAAWAEIALLAYSGTVEFLKMFIFSTMWTVCSAVRVLQSSVCVPFATVFNGKRSGYCLAFFG